MEVRSSLILDNLREQFPVLCFGKETDTPLLRPAFYGRSGEIEKGRIYVSRPNSLPPRQLLDNSMLLVCVEGMPSLAYQHCNMRMLVIRDASVMEVFNAVLSIFEKYEAWEKSLDNILMSNADVHELIQVTAPLLMNDITVIDKDLRVIAAASYRRNSEGRPEEIRHAAPLDAMPLEFARKYCRRHNELKDRRRPFFADEGCYCFNLFLDDQYWGNASLYPQLMPLRPSDPYIFDILATAILKALRINAISINSQATILEQLAWKLLEHDDVDYEKLSNYEAEHPDMPQGRFICLYIPLQQDSRKMSPDYMSQTIRKRVPDLIVFQLEDHLAGIADFAGSASGVTGFQDQLQKSLTELGLQAGISNRFHHLRNIRSYYQQALCALELGVTVKSDDPTYYFCDYALRYLMINSSGVFPSKYLCPPGLLTLRRYDEASDVDYWDTLRCYLDAERNIAHASKMLKIHRNTMVQRVERIQSLLEMDLDDPMNRLWLRVAMWIVDEENSGEIRRRD